MSRNIRYGYASPRPLLTVTVVLLGFDSREVRILLVLRTEPPFEAMWALPEEPLRIEDNLEDAAKRVARNFVGSRLGGIFQVGAMGEIARDPRERVVSIVYGGLLRDFTEDLRADRCRWFSLPEIDRLAFDHAQVLTRVLSHVRRTQELQPLLYELLPSRFSLSALQRFEEQVLGKCIDKRNFRKRLLRDKLVEPLDEYETGVSHRAARLYKLCGLTVDSHKEL